MNSTEVMAKISELVKARDWSQFHTPENLAKSISIEAAELLECFQWSRDADLLVVYEELADVLTYCFLLAHQLGVDPEKVILDKLQKTNEKYPVEKSRGKSDKYDRL